MYVGGRLFADRDFIAILIIKDQDLDIAILVGEFPDPLGVDAAVAGSFMRQHDMAAGRLFAQRIFKQGEVGTVLLGGRDFAQVVIAVDTNRVLAEALIVVLNGTAAGSEDELAGRGFAVQVLRRCQTGGDVAGTDGLTVLPDGQGLIRLVNDDAVVLIGVDHAQLVGADVAADKRAIFVAEGFDQRPAV